MQFVATGNGEVTVAVEYNFIPSELFAFPQYRGLLVDVVVQLSRSDGDGPEGSPVAAVPLSSVVVLTVQVTSFDDVGPARVEVPMPAGLEPIDPATAPDLAQLCDFDSLFGGSFSSLWWF